MPGYVVTWSIDTENLPSPRKAAEFAWAALRRKESTADVFDVLDTGTGQITRVDLEEPEAG